MFEDLDDQQLVRCFLEALFKVLHSRAEAFLVHLSNAHRIIEHSESAPYWTIGQSTLVVQSSLSRHAEVRIRAWLEECDKLHLDCRYHKIQPRRSYLAA